MTRISAVSDQGTCSCPGGMRTLQKLMQSELLDQFQRQPRAAELPAVLDPHARAVDLDEPRLGLGLRKEFAVAARRAADRPPARRPAGPLRPSVPDRPPSAAADHARCDTTRPAPNTLRVDRCADGSGVAGTCRHVSDDSPGLFSTTRRGQQNTAADSASHRHHVTTYVKKTSTKITARRILSKRWGSWASNIKPAMPSPVLWTLGTPN